MSEHFNETDVFEIILAAMEEHEVRGKFEAPNEVESTKENTRDAYHDQQNWNGCLFGVVNVWHGWVLIDPTNANSFRHLYLNVALFAPVFPPGVPHDPVRNLVFNPEAHNIYSVIQVRSTAPTRKYARLVKLKG